MTLVRIAALTLALLVGTSAMAQETAKPEKKPMKKGMNLAGTYTITSGMQAGIKSEKEAIKGKCTITKKMIKLEGPEGMSFEIAYTVDANAKPATIDMEIKKPEEFSSKANGIIKMEKGIVTLCYDPMGGDRPKTFTSTEKNGYNLFVMKKMPKMKKEDK